MTAPNTSRKFLRIAAGAVIAATLAAAPALAQSHGGRGDGNHARGGHRDGAHRDGAHRGDHNGGWNRGNGNHGGGWNRSYAGRVNDRWHGGWNRGWDYRGGYRGYRHYGPTFIGFGYYTDPFWARPYIGLSAWNWTAYDMMTEANIRAQQSAMIAATSAPLSDPINWSDGGTSGTVTPTREGHTEDGRLCREFQQQVTIAGKREQAFGTACQQSDGSWQIVDQDNAEG